jgi:arsenate reductase (glutaredoxin)
LGFGIADLGFISIRNPKSQIPNQNMSEKITVYEKPTCTTCRKLNKLFEENGVDYTKINYFIDAPSEEKLRELLKKANLTPFEVLRKAEPVYKELKISEVNDADALIKLIARNPSILQRPIVEVGDKAVLARPIENAIDLIKSAK